MANIVVDDCNQTEAYKAAGYSVNNNLPATVYQAASRFVANSNVVAWIQDLRQEVTDIVVANVAWDRERLIHQWSAANSALITIGKAAGLLEGQHKKAVAITKAMVVLAFGEKEHEDEALKADYRFLPNERKCISGNKV